MLVSPCRKPGTDHHFRCFHSLRICAKENSGLSPVSLRCQPGLRLSEQLLERLAARGRKVRIHPGTVLSLQIAKMAVAFRIARKQLRVERDLRTRINRFDAVLLADHLESRDAPH